ncbi:MAG: hypothetical protein ACM3SY_06595 [Candidatus Omnitrophota bacterium]
MRYILIKRTTMLVLITFLTMLITPHYSFGIGKIANTDDFEKAKQLYKNRYYDEATKLFNQFIERNRENKILKNKIIESYYYKAKICFLGEQFKEMGDDLENLFKLNIQYHFPDEENGDFLNQARAIQQKKLKQEKKDDNRIECESLKAKKKFPWLVVLGGAVVVGVLIYLITQKTRENTLVITVGEGIEGTPVAGSHSHKRGTTVNYSYTLKSGYSNLVVRLDDTPVAASGTIIMNKNHTLTATASKVYSLTVTKETGITGTPDTGIFYCHDGEAINYSYALQSGYRDLVVTIDGVVSPANGTILMTTNRTLTVNASVSYSLVVVKGGGVSGNPDSGTTQCMSGQTVDYSYYLQNGYRDLVVKLDETQITPSGTITMNQGHILVASATVSRTFELTVKKGAGVDGTPELGTYTRSEGQTVVYTYSLKSNYKNLVVKIDGAQVSPSGTIIMDRAHTLTASAELK